MPAASLLEPRSACGSRTGWLSASCSIRAFSRDPQRELASELRNLGYGVTEQKGRGRHGIVGVLHAVARRRDIRNVVGVIERHDPDAFVTIQNDAVVHRGWLYRGKSK